MSRKEEYTVHIPYHSRVRPGSCPLLSSSLCAPHSLEGKDFKKPDKNTPCKHSHRLFSPSQWTRCLSIASHVEYSFSHQSEVFTTCISLSKNDKQQQQQKKSNSNVWLTERESGGVETPVLLLCRWTPGGKEEQREAAKALFLFRCVLPSCFTTTLFWPIIISFVVSKKKN